ncbi:sensor histidine kinase [Nocardioides coralli]|uniref:sensor histidine kinase n=1 Tax=Nocardioides coralli TaxID=2872154 RepID=UPI001CA3E531|nr:HAMP domain-containing sensor histidine kinase [Nocardioides coralli]QZY29813.1 HAMP domain-containing histidine kinase [Nocardioides coralli]
MMGKFRIPDGVWGWHGTLLVALVCVTPALVAFWLAPETRNVEDAAGIGSLVVHPVVLAAALGLYFAWRLTGEPGQAWLAAAFVALAIKGFSFAALRLAHGPGLVDHSTTLLVTDLLFTATVVAMLWWGRAVPPQLDPLLLGVCLGVVFSAFRIGMVESGRGYPAAVLGILIFAGAGMALLYIAFAVAAATLVPVPAWARIRIVTAVVLLGLNQLVVHQGGEGVGFAVVSILTDLLFAVLLCVAASAVLRLTIRDSTSTVTELSRRVADVEERNRLDRERLHEMDAAIAGIVTASELIHDGTRLSPDRRAQLERMVEAEIARLGGLATRGPRVTPVGPVDLDQAIEPVVVAQRVLGRQVDWTPTGHLVRGRADDITEVVTTLLENAAQHAPGSPVRVAARDIGAAVELTVSDLGPGIPREVSARLFEWGERGPASRGQGIGLNVARRLVEDLGGSLRILSTPGCGATFVLRLPYERAGHGASRARA